MLEMPKAHTPQRNTLTGVNVTVTKVEKRYEMVQGQILNTKKMANQQGSPKGNPQRPDSLRVVGHKRLVSEVVCPSEEGEDMVCAHTKV